MKAASCILKIAAIALAIGAVACCVLANLDRITDGLLTLREQIAARRGCCCGGDCDCDIDEFEDWDA